MKYSGAVMLTEIHKKRGEGQVKKICNWFIHNASMQKKLIISYIILVSIPLCILGIHSFSAANQNLLDQTEVTMDNNLHRMCQEADAIFQRETDFTKYLAYNLEFRQTLEGNAYNGSAIAQSLNKTVEPVFWYFITSDENLKMIKIVTPNTASDIGSFLESAEPYEDTVWYKKHEKDFNTEWTVEEDGKLYATRTILDTATTSRRIGVLRAEFYLNRILEPFDTMDYLDNGIVIKDGNGQVIYTKKIADEQMEQKIEAYIGENPEDASVLNKEYILVNKYYYVGEKYVPENLESLPLSYSRSGMKLTNVAKSALEELINAAKTDNMTILVTSSYRSYEYQVKLYNQYAEENSKEEADTYSARPGYSEHQTGLAVDIHNGKKVYTDFENTEEFNWMQENAYKYGFILRFPKDKVNETGYIYESWHYRYVGKDIAKYIHKNNISFEEYYARFIENKK